MSGRQNVRTKWNRCAITQHFRGCCCATGSVWIGLPICIVHSIVKWTLQMPWSMQLKVTPCIAVAWHKIMSNRTVTHTCCMHIIIKVRSGPFSFFLFSEIQFHILIVSHENFRIFSNSREWEIEIIHGRRFTSICCSEVIGRFVSFHLHRTISSYRRMSDWLLWMTDACADGCRHMLRHQFKHILIIHAQMTSRSRVLWTTIGNHNVFRLFELPRRQLLIPLDASPK